LFKLNGCLTIDKSIHGNIIHKNFDSQDNKTSDS